MRRVELEGLLFWGVPGLVFFLIIIFTVLIGRKRKSFLQSLLQSIGLAILLHGIACLWWFLSVTDGLAQLVVMMTYGIAFAANILFSIGILYLQKK